MNKFRRRQRRNRQRNKYAPINVLASLMTTMNLYCGVASIFASIGLEYEKAAYFVLLAIVFDMLDGFVARLTGSSSDFGKELDSLCDVVSFGVAPAVLVFVAYLPEAAPPAIQENGSIIGKSGSYMAIIYAICTALRLARYNTFQSNRRDAFVGLPSPAAGGTLASLVLFLQYFEDVLQTHKFGLLAFYAIGPVALLLAFLMVSTVEYPKNRAKAFLLSPKHGFQVLGMFAIVLAVIHYAITKHPSIVLFPLGATYVLFGIVDTIYSRLFRRDEVRLAEGGGTSAGAGIETGNDVSATRGPADEGGGPSKNVEVL